MATAQNFAYAYSISGLPGTAITVNRSNPKTGISLTDTGTDNTAVLGDITNDNVTVTGLNNTNSTYYGTGVVSIPDGAGGFKPAYGVILADQNNKYWFLTDGNFTTLSADPSGTASSGGTWTLAGTGAPAAPTGLALATDTGLSSTDKITSVATIKGVAAAGSTVTLTIGGNTVGTGTADASGNFSITPTSGLVQGSNTVSVTSATSGGTSTASTLAFTYDTTQPTAPAITGITDDQAPATGNVAAGGSTNDTTPTISGTAEANSTVAIFNGATQLGTATANGSGAWTFTPTAALAQGTYTLTARATDAAGNQGAASAAYTVTVDTTPPNAPSITGVTDDQAPATGNVAANGTTNDATPTVTVSLTGTGAVAGNTVALLANGVQVATATLTTTNINNGTVSLTPTTALSGDGAKALTATVTDAAGNASTASAAYSITLDTTPPAAPTIGAVADNAGAIQGNLASGGTTDDATLALTGTAAAGSTVEILNGAAVLGTATADGSGAWAYTTPALSGSVSLTARAVDAAGNQSAASAAFTTTIDTTAPNAPSITGVTDDQAPTTGNVAAGGATNDATPTVAISLSGTNAVVGDTVSLLVGGTPVASTTLTAAQISAGTVSLTPATALSGDGTKTLTATVTDAAGNVSTASTSSTLVLDTIAPTETTTIRLATDTGASSTDGVTSNPALAGTVSGGQTGVLVTVFDGATAIGTATTTAGGAWTLANASAASGSHTYTARVTDAAGNLGPVGATSPATVTIDRTAPGTPAIGAITDNQGAVTGTVAANGATDDATPTVQVLLSGTGAAAGDTVTVSGASVVLTAAHISAGSVSLDVPLSGDGAKSLSATITDAAGNASAASSAVSIVLDTTAPLAPSIGSLSDDQAPLVSTVSNGGTTNDATPTLNLFFNGYGAVAGDTVRLYADGVEVGSKVLSAAEASSGTASVTSAALSGDGAKTFTATFTDAAGNVSPVSTGFAVTLDTTAPAAPTIGAVADNAGASQGDLASGASTDDATLALTGTAEANSTVAVFNGSTQLGTATANGSGAWSFTTAALADGAASLTARATDAAGNQGAASAAFTATIDTAAPSAPSITGVADDAGPVTGPVAPGAASDDATPTVSVSLGAAGNAAAGDTVSLLVGGTQVASKVLTAADIAAGTVSLAPAAALSGDGTKALTATITDAAGNVSAASAGRALVLDTTPPAETPTIRLASDTGPSGTDGYTSDPALSGTAPANAAVVIKDGGAVVGTATADAGGNWSFAPAGAAAADGAHSYTAQVADAAGNLGPASAPLAVTVDTVPPTETTTVGLAADTGASSTDGVTADATLTGAVSSGAAGVTVAVFDGSTAVGTATTGANGAWSFTPTGAAAADGAHAYTARVADAAGNLGPASAPLAVTVDTVPPTETTTIALAADTGASGADGVTSDPALTGAVSGGGAGVTVTVFDGGTAVGTATTGAGGVWSFAPSGAAAGDGAHSYTAAVTGPAGNLGPASAALGVTLDTVAPTPLPPSAPYQHFAVRTNLSDAETGPGTVWLGQGATTRDATPTARMLLPSDSGLVAGDTVKLLADGVEVGSKVLTAEDFANGVFDVTPSAPLPGDGPKALTLVFVDAAGNASAPTGAVNIVLDTTAPTETPTIGLVSDTGASGADGVTADPALSGTGPANATIVVKDGDTVVGTATADANGNWTLPNDGAADGAHSYTAQVSDEAGNLGPASAALAVTLDTAAPTATTTVALASDTGVSPTDGITADPALTGTVSSGEAGVLVSILDGGTVVGTATTGEGGAWSFANEGTTAFAHSYTAAVTDAAGNRGPASAALEVRIDTDAPIEPGTAVVIDDAGPSQGQVEPGAPSDDTTPTLQVTIPDWAVAGDTLTVFVNGEVFQTAVLTGVETTSGNITLQGAAPLAGDGAKVFTATLSDAAGNTSATVEVATMALDTTAPAETTTVALASDTGASSTDGVTADPVLTGTVSSGEAGVLVTIRDGETVVGTATTGEGGVWSFANADAATAYGTHYYTAQVADAAGNLGVASEALAVEISRAGDEDLSFLATPGADAIAGEDGSDTIAGGEGDDTLWGDDEAGDAAGDGADSLLGGDGDDLLEGGGGADVLAGGPGADTVRGGAGDDTIEGAAGEDAGDLFDGGEGRDEYSHSGADGVVIDLAAGTSSTGATLSNIEDVWTDAGNDLVRGDANANRLRGWGGDDTLEGAAGADSLEGEDGADSLAGGSGDDTLAGGAGADTLDGGAGDDTAVFSGAKGGYTVVSGTDEGGRYFLVTDTDPADGDDGADKVYGAEFLRFADQTDPVCFYPGTLVAVPGGEAPVETLKAGDMVLTADGKAAPVRWLGRQTVSTRFADPLRALPVRIVAGALGEGLPKRDLLVSPDHAILVDGVLVQAGALVDGAAIRREAAAAVPGVFTYWHVELADHALVLAEGVAAESFIDNVARMAFDNWAEHGAAAAPAPLAEMALPRAKSARQVPAATRRRLAERAAVLLGKEEAA